VEIPEDHQLVLWLFVDVFSVVPTEDIQSWDDDMPYDENDEDLVFAVEMAKDAFLHPTWYMPVDDIYYELDSSVRVGKPKKARKEKKQKVGKEKKVKPVKAVAPKSKLEAPGVKRYARNFTLIILSRCIRCPTHFLCVWMPLEQSASGAKNQGFLECQP